MDNKNLPYKKVILFDGVCNLCSAFLSFIYLNDPRAKFTFAWLQSDEAKRLLSDLPQVNQNIDSIIYIETNQIFYKSTAFLKIIRQLRFPWPLLWFGIIIPRPLRDWIYDIVARNRYRWFGKKEQCLVPDGDLKKRFYI
jgi:predicted DCC family thiol-disulfide oxidoreductase YuxK